MFAINSNHFAYTIFLLFLCMLFFPLPSSAEEGEQSLHGYPEIKRLFITDDLYKQHQRDIQEYYKKQAKGAPLPALTLYTYTIKKEDDLYSIAARLNLPYESIASLNHMDRLTPLKEGTNLLIPNLPGTFLPTKPKTELQFLMTAITRQYEGPSKTIRIPVSGREIEEFLFFPGRRFSKEELAFFLGILFRFPLPKGIITSYYGTRKHPFSGKFHFHGGIDIAGPLGTSVLAARKGKVVAIGEDEILGNYLVLAHTGGYQTVYGHLKKRVVGLHQTVNSGMIIATLGNSGMSTGPHLHFEIRRNGSSTNPMPLMFGNGR
jgi:murein DD-endopeptidase MepM/ murein hydrolase activator NlpD